MKRVVTTFKRSLLLAATLLVFIALTGTFPPASLSQSEGQNLKQSVVAAGGVSANGNTRLESSIGQPVAEASGNGPYALATGFWVNAVACPFSLSRVSHFFTTAGGSGSITVTAAGNCTWNVATNDTWIIITSDGSVSGNGVVDFEIRENFTTAPRQGRITLGDFTASIIQDGGLNEDCGYSISPPSVSIAPAGGAGSFQVIAESRCAWQVTSDVSWVTFTSRNVGLGNGLVTFVAGANTTPLGRKANLSVAGKVFVVKQKGAS